jgi:flagellar biosynthesis protein FlhF
MQEALKQVRSDLGSEAIIVSTKTGDTRKRRRGAATKGKVEVVAAIDYDLDSSKDRKKEFSRLVKQGMPRIKTLPAGERLLEGAGQAGEVPERETSSLAVPAGQKETEFLRSELKELKWLTQFLVRKAEPLNQQHLPEQLFNLSCRMLKQEVSEDLVARMLGELQQECAPENLEDSEQVRHTLISKMGRELSLSGPINLNAGSPKIAAFVGPTGVGKTTTVAKLAAQYSLSEKKKVALLSIDNYRIAAIEQLKVYATIMNLPFKAVSSKEDLGKALDDFADKDLILIDTAGRSQQNHISEIKQFLNQTYPIETYLVMSVTCTDNNLRAISHQFEQLSVDRLIFTKLDESCTYGTLVNQLTRIEKPLAYFTTGQKVPEDIEVATQERIVSLLLDETEVHYC